MLAFLFTAALAASSPCPEHFAAGVEPSAPAVVELCFTGFAVGYSPAWREPAWSAEQAQPVQPAAPRLRGGANR